jgi:copper transport protein
VVTAAALVAVVAAAVVGHTRAYEPVPLLVVTDMLHLAAGTAWLGGLVGLAFALRALSGRERDAALALSRFSTLAATVLALLVATGSLMSWRILGSWGGFADTTYGRLLLVKIGVVAVVALVAGFNRFRLLPRVSGGVGHDAVRRGALAVRTAVRVEALLIIGVLALTGFLVNQSPREDLAAARPPVPSRVSVGVLPDATVLATLAPGRRGPNTVTVQVQDETGEPLDGFAAPVLSVRGGAVDLGEVPVVPVAAGTYQADVVFPAPGTWELQVSLKASEFDNPVTTVEVEVS